jgi:hypothetical protein
MLIYIKDMEEAQAAGHRHTPVEVMVNPSLNIPRSRAMANNMPTSRTRHTTLISLSNSLSNINSSQVDRVASGSSEIIIHFAAR